MLIRVADEADWPQIWPFFAEIVAAGETYAYPLDLTTDTGRALWMSPAEGPPAQTVVAVEEAAGTSGPDDEDGAVLGSAKIGPNRPGRGAHVATAAFMVDPAHAGRGIGRALASYAIDWARAAGYRSMQFNAVVETNTSAVHLWQSVGFDIIGTVPEAFDHARLGLVGLHVMYRRL